MNTREDVLQEFVESARWSSGGMSIAAWVVAQEEMRRRQARDNRDQRRYRERVKRKLERRKRQLNTYTIVSVAPLSVETCSECGYRIERRIGYPYPIHVGVSVCRP